MFRLKKSSSRKRRLSSSITLRGAIWIASDIHLGPHTPATRQVFHDFLDEARAKADALILCGDIFDVWVGDDFAVAAPPSWLASSLVKFRQVAQTIPLWLGRGNRDFLLGSTLAGHLGAQLLPDTCRLSTDHGTILLSHGDQYCTADKGYQRFRRLVRNPVVQRMFLSLGLPMRNRVAEWARGRSMASNQHKIMSIMDVAPDAIEQALGEAGLTTIVHGHTHRPGVHHFQMGELACTRVVLPDWDFDGKDAARGGWLAIDQRGLTLESAMPTEAAART